MSFKWWKKLCNKDQTRAKSVSADSWICQTSAAATAEPGDLPQIRELDLSEGYSMDYAGSGSDFLRPIIKMTDSPRMDRRELNMRKTNVCGALRLLLVKNKTGSKYKIR
jgi:hypothetical protein